MEVARLFHELIRPRGEGTPIFFKKTLGLFRGFDWKQRFLLQKFHPMATLRLTLDFVIHWRCNYKIYNVTHLGPIFITW